MNSIILVNSKWHILDSDNTLCGLSLPNNRLIRHNSHNSDCKQCNNLFELIPPPISEEEAIQKCQNFMTELIALYKKYGLAISHEDTHGAFIITFYDKSLEEWIMYADLELNNIHLDYEEWRGIKDE